MDLIKYRESLVFDILDLRRFVVTSTSAINLLWQSCSITLTYTIKRKLIGEWKETSLCGAICRRWPCLQFVCICPHLAHSCLLSCVVWSLRLRFLVLSFPAVVVNILNKPSVSLKAFLFVCPIFSTTVFFYGLTTPVSSRHNSWSDSQVQSEEDNTTVSPLSDSRYQSLRLYRQHQPHWRFLTTSSNGAAVHPQIRSDGRQPAGASRIWQHSVQHRLSELDQILLGIFTLESHPRLKLK